MEKYSVFAAKTVAPVSNPNCFFGLAESRVVRDAATFASLWAARVGGPAPQVDFALDQVLMVFEPASTRRHVSLAATVMLEDEELFVTVNSQLRVGAPTRGAPFDMITTARNFGPVSFETVDTTPRP